MAKSSKSDQDVDALFNNPALYREMLTPQPMAEAEKNLDGFFKDLYELRRKHRIPNIVCGVEMCINTEDGGEGFVMSTLHIGDALKAEPMSAYLFGRMQSTRQQLVAKALKQEPAVRNGGSLI